ncbi:hypothetical protein [Streptomyces sp. NPDC088733]|uniref:hypothetical protein n=1 Tax=Streptomyces sp. NPDC088733 TaxID=3365880 RepID=UPI0037F1263D
MTEREPVPWAQLAADDATVARYSERVYRRAPDACWWWLGAISDTGHGKFRAGARAAGTSRVVSAHVLGWIVEHGVDTLGAGLVVRHRCDEGACQNPTHWVAGARADNIADYYARRGRLGGPLADVRGAAGRAVAVRDAILAALPGGPEAVEAAIAVALAAGHPSGAQQDPLW